VVYNVFDQAPEDELFPLCRELGVAVIARVPLDEGSLAGTLTVDSRWPDGDWRNTYFSPANLAATVSRVEALRPLVPEGQTMAQLALRFILSSPDVTTVIPGMRRTEHLAANTAAAAAGPLPADLLAALRAHRWDRPPSRSSQSRTRSRPRLHRGGGSAPPPGRARRPRKWPHGGAARQPVRAASGRGCRGSSPCSPRSRTAVRPAPAPARPGWRRSGRRGPRAR
jgi:hypothetical protein